MRVRGEGNTQRMDKPCGGCKETMRGVGTARKTCFDCRMKKMREYNQRSKKG